MGRTARVAVPLVALLGTAAFLCASAAASSTPERAAPAAAPVLDVAQTSSQDTPRVMLIGVDGADWSRITPLIDSGRLPNIARLVKGGYAAPLATLKPTLSPVIWTTIATGVPASLHGVHDFTSVWLPGLSRGIQWSYDKYGSPARLPAHVGLVALIGTLLHHGWIEETPIDALHRRQKALWNILSERGIQSAFVRWWATWPAEQFDGWMLSDNDPLTQVFAAALAEHTSVNAGDENLTWPTGLAGELLPLIAQDGPIVSAKKKQAVALLDDPIFADMTEQEQADSRAHPERLATFELICRGDRFATRAAIKLWNEHPVRLLGVYLRAVDNISHRFGKRRGVVDHTYEFIDARVGELLAAGGQGTTYLLVSDHGWCYQEPGFGHHDAPPGVIILQGPGIQPSHADLAATVFNVAPTVLALFGLPPSSEMTGKPLLEVFAPGSAAAEPRARIPTYGDYRPKWPPFNHSADSGRKQSVELLRTLGYL